MRSAAREDAEVLPRKFSLWLGPLKNWLRNTRKRPRGDGLFDSARRACCKIVALITDVFRGKHPRSKSSDIFSAACCMGGVVITPVKLFELREVYGSR